MFYFHMKINRDSLLDVFYCMRLKQILVWTGLCYIRLNPGSIYVSFTAIGKFNKEFFH